MRITNTMMLSNTKSNINSNKLNVNDLNSQMSSQKKISRPSEDPVVAIRALRLRSTLSEVNQYYEKNIPDAESWLSVTETALSNMESILKDVRTQCVYGATGTLKTEDRDAILNSLTKLREQMYAEGNSDYAGRRVFTGYRTNQDLTFMHAESNTCYQITETFDIKDIEEGHRYYKGEAVVPTRADIANNLDNNTANNVTIGDLERTSCDRIRFSYDSLDINANSNPAELENQKLQYTKGELDANGELIYYELNSMQTASGTANVKVYEHIEDWKNDCTDFENAVGANDIIVIADTGEMLLGKDVSTALKANNYSVAVSYQKTGFNEGELRPEYYFNCKDVTDTDTTKHVTYEKYDAAGKEIPQDINYLIAANQTLTINTNASDVFDAAAGRDVDEMMDAVQYSIDAHDKVTQIEEMMALEENASDEKQAELELWYEAAKKEADFADDNLARLFNTYIGNFDKYLTNVEFAITAIGSKGDQLELTETRMSNQQLTVTELKSSNEDRELSDIIIDYTSAYTAYQGSLQAASKINQNTLLSYL